MGVPGNPFLLPGAYTVTLTIEDESMTMAFSVFDYELVRPTEDDAFIE